MALNIILQNSHQLATGQLDDEYLQQTVIYDVQTVLLVFEKSYQLWNIRANKKLLQTKKDERIFYFCHNAFIDEFNVAFVSYEMENPVPYLGSINLKTSQVTKIVDFEKDEVSNHDKLLVLKNEKGTEIIVTSANKKNALSVEDGKSREISYEGANALEMYNESNAYVIFSTSANQDSIKFTVVKNGIPVKHDTKQKEAGEVIAIKEYANQKSLIVCGKENTGVAYIYDHSSGKIEESSKIQFRPDSVFKKGDKKWIACKSEQKEESYMQFQSLFSPNSEVIKRAIPEWNRVENNHFIGCLDKAENGTTTIQNFAMLSEESVYIHLLEEMGLVNEFGNDIVKAVINNLI